MRHAVPAVYSGIHMVGSAFHSKVRYHRDAGDLQRKFYLAAGLYGVGIRGLTQDQPIPGEKKKKRKRDHRVAKLPTDSPGVKVRGSTPGQHKGPTEAKVLRESRVPVMIIGSARSLTSRSIQSVI